MPLPFPLNRKPAPGKVHPPELEEARDGAIERRMERLIEMMADGHIIEAIREVRAIQFLMKGQNENQTR